MTHDVYTAVRYRRVIVTICGQAHGVRGWVRGEFAAIKDGEGWGWKVHRLAADGTSVELVRGLDRDAAIGIANDAGNLDCTRLEAFQGVLRVHLGDFAL